MNNRKWNAKNPHQGTRTKCLCVCSAGLLRSPTTAVILANDPVNFNTRAVGLERDFALIPIDDVLIDWADVVVCMNIDQSITISETGFTGKIYNFQIPDNFEYMDPELIRIIQMRVQDMDNWLYQPHDIDKHPIDPYNRSKYG